MKNSRINAFCIAGTNSGVGKTVITLALIRAFVERGLKVQPFKCGPDYIDSEFHTKAAHNSSYNLDTWMMGEEQVKKTFVKHTQNVDIAVVEGVMGLFDGAELDSLKGSTASVADLLDIPIILVVDAKSMAQSIAAVVKGYNTLYPETNIAGVIANNVGSNKHKTLLENVLKKHNLPPLIGSIPKNKAFELSERHLGLTPDSEVGKADEWYSEIGKVIEKNINCDVLLNISQIERPKYIPQEIHADGVLKINNRSAVTLSNLDLENKSVNYDPAKYNTSGIHISDPKIKLGYANDDAFHFYYKDNLDLLEDNGFELIPLSPLYDKKLPDNLDALYLGGGFPEMFIEQLSSNRTMIRSIKEFAENNGIIFAECGGYMYLVDEFITSAGNRFPMCGILNGTGRMTNRLQNFGYKEVCLDKDCILGKKGTKMKGHEFHWSTIDFDDKNDNFFLARNINQDEWKNTGQIHKNVFASYIHLHFLSNPEIELPGIFISCNSFLEKWKEQK